MVHLSLGAGLCQENACCSPILISSGQAKLTHSLFIYLFIIYTEQSALLLCSGKKKLQCKPII